MKIVTLPWIAFYARLFAILALPAVVIDKHAHAAVIRITWINCLMRFASLTILRSTIAIVYSAWAINIHSTPAAHRIDKVKTASQKTASPASRGGKEGKLNTLHPHKLVHFSPKLTQPVQILPIKPALPIHQRHRIVTVALDR